MCIRDRGDAQAVVAHSFGNAGGVAVGHSAGGLRGDVPGGEAGAACGEHKVHLTTVCHADELRFQRLGFVRQDHGLFHHIASGGEHFYDQRAAFILPLLSLIHI